VSIYLCVCVGGLFGALLMAMAKEGKVEGMKEGKNEKEGIILFVWMVGDMLSLVEIY